ncbi:hypothetical protein MMC25_005043 [Agyrium rufum]|nr:hypothetical protein [Agyrium rufum]
MESAVVPAISIYAEYLSNIKQVSVSITLPSLATTTTSVALDEDQGNLTIRHEGDQITSILPAHVSNNVPLEIPDTVLSWSLRLPVAVERLIARNREHEEDVPWVAERLNQETEIACCACRTNVLKGPINRWSNLPSDNWAELMDFWHCHKPENPDGDHDQGSGSKAYAAGNKPQARRGVGYVNASSFVLHQDDCCISPTIDASPTETVTCAGCGSQLGHIDQDFEGIRLNKWDLTVRTLPSVPWESYGPGIFATCIIMDNAEYLGRKKLVVYSGDVKTSSTALLVWIFSPKVKYSSSSLLTGPRTAVKVMYKLIDNPWDVINNDLGSMLAETALATPLMQAVLEMLRQSQSTLPEDLRTFQDWNVGLLDRFNG